MFFLGTDADAPVYSLLAAAYPYTGSVGEVGVGGGEGTTINLPLPGDSGEPAAALGWAASVFRSASRLEEGREGGVLRSQAVRSCPCLPRHPTLAGHEAALAAFDELVAPAARRFRPDIIIASAGYDAHWRDPLAGARPHPAPLRSLLHAAEVPADRSLPRRQGLLSVVPLPLAVPAGLQFRSSTYHALGARLKALADELCSGRLVFLLEGGGWAGRGAHEHMLLCLQGHTTACMRPHTGGREAPTACPLACCRLRLEGSRRKRGQHVPRCGPGLMQGTPLAGWLAGHPW